MTDAAAIKDMLHKAYQRWHDTRGGSTDDWFEILDDDISFGSLLEGADPDGLTCRLCGRAALSQYFDGFLSGWEMIHYTVDEILVDGDRAVAIGSTAWRNKKTGKTAETRKADVWRFRDGKAVEFYEYFDTAKLLAAME